jgi:crossover junction endodeoxyribonuclease RusA
MPARQVTVDVRGTPRPQGSVNAHPIRNKAGQVVGTAVRYSNAVKMWRAQLYQALEAADVARFCGPVEVWLAFELPRPQDHFGTGRNAGALKASAPSWHTITPDLDKLVRAVLDACTDTRVWTDDSQVVTLMATKRFANPHPGVHITISELADAGVDPYPGDSYQEALL